MKTSVFKTLIALVILLAVSFTSKGEYEKKVHRAWPVKSVNTLSVDNKFGDINFISTRDDSVVIDVVVTIENLTGKKAEYLTDMINFKFSVSDGKVKAETVFSDDFKTNQEFKIVYTINIPENKNLEVENQFGNVTMGNLNANGYFEISYGNIHGKELVAPIDQYIKLELKYGAGSFANVNRLKAEVSYSKFNALNIDIANLETKYSVLSFDICNQLLAESQYDSYRIDEADNAKIETKFTGWKIEQLNKNLLMENQYGDIDVDHVSAGFESIKLENRYGNIKFGIDREAGYHLRSEARYCDVRYPKDADTRRYIEDNHETTIDAVVGTGEPNSTIIIESRYGKVDLMK